jgi:hypothetical protein
MGHGRVVRVAVRQCLVVVGVDVLVTGRFGAGYVAVPRVIVSLESGPQCLLCRLLKSMGGCGAGRC